jgi:hypothetical protein
MIKGGEIPDEMKPQLAYDYWCQQQPFFIEKKLFKSRLRSLREQIKKYAEYAAVDNAAFADDLQLRTTNTHDSTGNPRWDGSAAQELLRHDVKEGLHKLYLRPMGFHASRPQYQEFTLEVFRNHIYQEVKTDKWYKYQSGREEKTCPWNC